MIVDYYDSQWVVAARFTRVRGSRVYVPISGVVTPLCHSMVTQSTQLENGYLALIRQCLELVRYMLQTALDYFSRD